MIMTTPHTQIFRTETRTWAAAVAALFLLVPFAAESADVKGTLQWSQRVEMSTPASGVVRDVRVRAGERVKKGEVLLSLEAGPYQAQVAEAEAAIGRLKEEAEEAKRDLDRTQELYDRTVIATTELDQAKLRHARASGLLSEAQARLRRNRAILGDTQVRAPFDAWVVARNAEPGQTVAAALQPPVLLVLAKAGEMAARANVSVDQIARVRVGQEVSVSVGGQRYSGKVRNAALEPLSGSGDLIYPVEVVFPTHQILRAGTPATLHLP